MYVVGILLLWLMCFSTNQTENDPKTTNDKQLYFNTSALYFGQRSAYKKTYPKFRNGYTSNPFAYNFDRRCYEFFTTTSCFYTTAYAFIYLGNITLKPRFQWVICVVICYGTNSIFHFSSQKNAVDNGLMVGSGIVGFFCAFFVLNLQKPHFCSCARS